MTRTTPVTSETQRAARRTHLARLEALTAPTASEQALRRRLLDLEAADPADADEADLRRILGIQ